MAITIKRATGDEIAGLRKLFLEEFNNQFIYDKCHYYGWSDDYLLLVDEQPAGYACTWGLNDRNERDTLFEAYLLPPFRKQSDAFWHQLLQLPGVSRIECQSNDRYLSAQLFRFANNIFAEAILFEENIQTHLSINGTEFRERGASDLQVKDDDGPYVLLYDGKVVAHGGLMLNYNFPYADIYMHVFEEHQRKGFGALIVQELKLLAYKLGRVPAARCNINNIVSKTTLEKAGLKPCGFVLIGSIKKS